MSPFQRKERKGLGRDSSYPRSHQSLVSVWGHQEAAVILEASVFRGLEMVNTASDLNIVFVFRALFTVQWGGAGPTNRPLP